MAGHGISVWGSLNIDLTVRVQAFVRPGQTVPGQSFHTFTGGKGGNQAVAAARLGADVRMIACVGDDLYGEMYRDVLRREGVDVSCLSIKRDASTGTALIEVEDSGENRIVVVAGANARLTTAAAVRYSEVLSQSAYLLMQLETPMVGVLAAAEAARSAGVTVIMDPAPVRPLDEALLRLCDYVTPNETELQALTGMPVGTLEQAERACRELLARGAGAVVNKRGAEGALYVDRDGAFHVPAFAVKAVDTTAAGDTFNAALAVGLDGGMSVREALRFANAAAGLSTTGLGAQTAMPDWNSVEDTIRYNKLRKFIQHL